MNFPIGDGKMLNNAQLAGVENGISLTGWYSVENSIKAGELRRKT
jgi:hypothetical protein